jgi:hypothetical protein
MLTVNIPSFIISLMSQCRNTYIFAALLLANVAFRYKSLESILTLLNIKPDFHKNDSRLHANMNVPVWAVSAPVAAAKVE